MIDAQGTITAVNGDTAEVLMDETGCGRCHEEGGCGGHNIGKMLCASPRTFQVVNPGNSAVGDRVTVVIAEGAVRRSATAASVSTGREAPTRCGRCCARPRRRAAPAVRC